MQSFLLLIKTYAPIFIKEQVYYWETYKMYIQGLQVNSTGAWAKNAIRFARVFWDIKTVFREELGSSGIEVTVRDRIPIQGMFERFLKVNLDERNISIDGNSKIFFYNLKSHHTSPAWWYSDEKFSESEIKNFLISLKENPKTKVIVDKENHILKIITKDQDIAGTLKQIQNNVNKTTSDKYSNISLQEIKEKKNSIISLNKTNIILATASVVIITIGGVALKKYFS